MSDNTFYIIVNKDSSGKFIINENNEDPNNTSSESPDNAISGTTPFKVQVNVTTGNATTEANSFTVGNSIYTLVLNAAATATNKIWNKDTFKAAANAAAPAEAAVVTESTGEGESAQGAATGEGSRGGQKQKQQKSKRNYSKKRRSFKSKSDTLRNYFNYDHLQ